MDKMDIVIEMAQEIKRLRIKCSEMQETNDLLIEAHEILQARLEFYGDSANYVFPANKDTSLSSIDLDAGDLARKVIENNKMPTNNIQGQKLYMGDDGAIRIKE